MKQTKRAIIGAAIGVVLCATWAVACRSADTHQDASVSTAPDAATPDAGTLSAHRFGAAIYPTLVLDPSLQGSAITANPLGIKGAGSAGSATVLTSNGSGGVSWLPGFAGVVVDSPLSGSGTSISHLHWAITPTNCGAGSDVNSIGSNGTGTCTAVVDSMSAGSGLNCSTTSGAATCSVDLTTAAHTINATLGSTFVNDWAPTGIATASVIFVNTNVSTAGITGLSGGVDGRMVTICNVGSFELRIFDHNGGSLAANQFSVSGQSEADLFPGTINGYEGPDCADFVYWGSGAVWQQKISLDFFGLGVINGLTIHGGGLEMSSIKIQDVDHMSLVSASGNTAYIDWSEGSATAVSPSGEGRLIYNNVSHTFETSTNGGAYQNVGTITSVAASTGLNCSTTSGAATCNVNLTTTSCGAGSAVTSISASGIGTCAAIGPIGNFSGGVIRTAGTGSISDWAPTGIATAHTIFVTPTGNMTVTSMLAGSDGQLETVCNLASSFSLSFTNNGAGTAGNKIAMANASTWTLTAQSVQGPECTSFIYDLTNTIWRQIETDDFPNVDTSGLNATGPTTLSGGVSISGGGNAFTNYANGSAASTGAANTGTLRYNSSTQTFEASENGNPFLGVAKVTGGALTTGIVPVATGSDSMGNSSIHDNGTTVSTAEAVSLTSTLAVTSDATLSANGIVKGHIKNTGGTAITTSNLSCGASPVVAAGSTDIAGTITIGSSTTTSCAITWNVANTTATNCVVSQVAAAGGGVLSQITSSTASVLTVAFASGTSPAKFSYVCVGN